jgi:hypothetical protein
MGSDNSADPRLVKLLHRRRGWAWTGIVSLIATLLYLISLVSAAATITVVILFVLLALTIVSLGIALVDTVRLRRFPADALSAAREAAAHHPVHQHHYQVPPHHAWSWGLGWLSIGFMFFVALIFLPNQVNGVAYLVGAEHTTTFTATDNRQVCSRGGCTTETDGVLSDGTNVTWPNDVAVGQSFSVREPAWPFFTGRNLIDSTGTAVGDLVIGLVFEFIAGLVGFGAVSVVRVMRQVHELRATSEYQLSNRSPLP